MADKKVKKNKVLQSGFSDRLNLVLDEIGYPPMEHGRVSRLAEDINLTKMTISKWLSKGIVPHGSNLKTLSRLLLRKLGSIASIESMERWLIEGDETLNPLVLSSHKGIDYTLFSQVFQSVDKVAREAGIDLEGISQDKLDQLYTIVFKQAARHREHELDRDLIMDLLKTLISR